MFGLFDFREPIHNLCLGAMLMFRKNKKEKSVFTVACEAIYWIAADNGRLVEWFFLEVPWGCLQFVIVVFPDHTHLLFLPMYCIPLIFHGIKIWQF